MPKLICLECIARVRSIVDSIKKYQNNDLILKNILKNELKIEFDYTETSACSEELKPTVQNEIDFPIDTIELGNNVNHNSKKCEKTVNSKLKKISKVKKKKLQSDKNINNLKAENNLGNLILEKDNNLNEENDLKKISKRKFVNKSEFICHHCGLKLPRRSAYLKHEKIHTKPFICEICNYRFSGAYKLKTHKIAHHFKDDDQPYYLKEGVEAWMKCLKCSRLFPVKQKLLKHMKACFNLKSDKNPDSIETIIEKSLAYFKSPIDNFTKDDFINLVIASYKLPKQKIVKIPCEICGKLVAQCRKKSHALMHKGLKPYKCDLCESSFRTITNLKKHKSTVHLKLRPFQCVYCEKNFSEKKDMQTHIRVHTGDKPYICNLCSKGFTSSSSLSQHKISHGIYSNIYSCPKCSNNFLRKSTMIRHVKRCYKLFPSETNQIEEMIQNAILSTLKSPNGCSKDQIELRNLLMKACKCKIYDKKN